MGLLLQRGAATLQREAAISRSGTVTPAGNERIHSAHSFAAGDSDSITGADGCCAISEARTDAVRAARGATNRGSAIGIRERATDGSLSTASPDCSRAATSTNRGSALGTARGDGRSASSPDGGGSGHRP